jgi:hypothetical protein
MQVGPAKLLVAGSMEREDADDHYQPALYLPSSPLFPDVSMPVADVFRNVITEGPALQGRRRGLLDRLRRPHRNGNAGC